MSNLIYILDQIEVIGFILLIVGLLILGAWLIIDGLRDELNGD